MTEPISIFDPKTLTDDQLDAKMAELMSKLTIINRNGLGGAMQITEMINQMDFERRERGYMAYFNMIQKSSPVVIETDPGLRDAAANQQAKKNEQTKMVRPRVPVRRVAPTPAEKKKI